MAQKRKAASTLFLGILFVFIGQNAALAAPGGPDDVIREMVGKLKTSASAAPIVDYVDWSGLFKQVNPQQRQMMQVETAEALKEYYRKVLADPVAAMEERNKAKLSGVPPEQKAKVEEGLNKQRELIKQKQNAVVEQLRDTEYSVGEPKIDGELASVPLTRKYKNETKEDQIPMIKVGEAWLLRSPTLQQQKPQVAKIGPTGAVPAAPPAMTGENPAGANSGVGASVKIGKAVEQKSAEAQ